MRKRIIPPSKREDRLVGDPYGRLFGLPRSICGKPQRIGCVMAVERQICYLRVCNLGGNTDPFVPYGEGVLIFYGSK